MARKTQPKSAPFTLTPAAPLEVVQKGMETAKADLLARLTQRRNEDVRFAGVQRKLVLAQLDVMQKSGVDVADLVNEAKQLSQQVRDARKEPLPIPPGLQPEIPTGFPPELGVLVTPPYNYDWSATGYINYAPSTLTAYANRQTGALGFHDDSWDPSTGRETQVDRSYAAAAVGIFFRPQIFGALTVSTVANMILCYYYDAEWAGANTRAWAGFLVQAFDSNNSLVWTPVYQQIILFDKGSNGRWIDGDSSGPVPFNDTVVTPAFLVTPDLWYAIWFWCGGDIHAEGQRAEWPAYTYSFASSVVDASVPYLLLFFQRVQPR